MEYRRLGRSGLKISPICLGTMMFGDQTDEAIAGRMADLARDRGINFIDTADAYSRGGSEEVTGRLIAGDRDQWVLATKLANNMGGGALVGGLSRRWCMQACDDSLRRLGTDYIDIYYLHKEDHETPLGETVRAMADLQRAGKIRYFGLSNHRSWRVAEICRLCDDIGVDRPVVSQPYYNAMNRMPEAEHLPACDFYGLGVVPYSPLARGVLTGKYQPDENPEQGTRAARQDRRMMQTEWRQESLLIAKKLKQHAEAKGLTASQFALLWVLNNKLITATIAGPRTEAQWQENLDALNGNFDAEDEKLVDELVMTGHPSTPGYNDPAYPLEGRLPYTD